MLRSVHRTVIVVALVLGALALAGPAFAHQTEDCPDGQEECPALVAPRWRENIVPLFGTEVGETEEERTEERRQAERWRDEWGCDTQFCVWAKPSVSVDDEEGPATVHVGAAGDHSLTEGAHPDEAHESNEFGNHDTHGGTIYADVCLGSDGGTSFEGQAGACSGPEDTQVGVVVKDHLGCPLCMDEYHQVRPLDPDYTQAQLAETQAGLERAACNPEEQLLGYGEDGPDPAC